MLAADSCVGFDIACETLLKGGLAVIMAFILFIGSVYLILAAVFGRRMGYLVLAVSFFGWMIALSSLWTFGFFSQGPTTPTNLGPRGTEPAWVVLSADQGETSDRYPEFAGYPEGPWEPAGNNDEEQASIQSATSAIQGFLAEHANEEIGKGEFEVGAIQPTEFTVEDLLFAGHDGVSLAAARAFYAGGGPVLTVNLYHDSGSQPRYSWMFLAGSVIGFAVHLPLLDRAERKRKEILTGGSAPPWYGPA